MVNMSAIMGHCTCVVLLITTVFKSIDGSFQQNFGKVNITDKDSCGFFCGQVFFSPTFQKGSKIKVFPTVSHENHPDITNEPSVVMVKSVRSNMFSACVMVPGKSSWKVTLNWFAFSNHDLPKGVQTGDVPNTMFTGGSYCTVVTFTQSFVSPPKIFISVRRPGSVQRKDAMSLWAKDISAKRFTICLKEMINFSGKHENLIVDWVAFTKRFSSNMTDLSSVMFNYRDQSSLKDNRNYCQVNHFARRFFDHPVVILSAHRHQSLNTSVLDESIIAWVKDVNKTSFEVCSKDRSGLNLQHVPVTVDYAIIGDVDPCIGIKCDKFAVCRAFGPYDPRCVCVEDCPVAKQHVCASNGRSFDNLCLYRLEVCRTSANYTYLYPGHCRDFPTVKGHWILSQVPGWSDSHCQRINFEPLTFYPHKPVDVQISVSHVNRSNQVHEAAVSWVEDISYRGFKVCVTEPGRNEGPPHGFATVEWMAYQGAPHGGASGVVSLAEWWTGTECQTVNISSIRFSSTPTVLVTAGHHRRGIKHDSASLWLEDVSRYSFKVCLRELQNFDGAHRDIFVSWLAFAALERPLFTEHGSAEFVKNTQTPLAETNYAECKNVSLAANYSSLPIVLISPKHNTSGGNLDPRYNGITAWTESITVSNFQTCIKELFVNQPVTLTFVVLQDICEPGWTYYKRFCYKKVIYCQTWISASSTCLAVSSNIVDIENVEEDVFVQHLHKGRTSWIGLNDRANEGVYLWTNGKRVTYTRWSPGISSSSAASDCVYSLGRKYNYFWKRSSCDKCKHFTCKKDFDECVRRNHDCDPNADCINTIGSYTCQCRTGYTGDGKNCEDIDECSHSTNKCAANTDCVNSAGSYTCRCRNGYSGDGHTCSDINECVQSNKTCDSNADCINSIGSYTCQCHHGYKRNGRTCTAYCGNPGKPYGGYARGSSFTYGSRVYFSCNYPRSLSGPSFITCQANSRWSNRTPQCNRRYYG